MSVLIVSEKNNTAKRIGKILSSGKSKEDKLYKIPIYTFQHNGSDFTCLGLKGHILKPEFPEEYRKWQNVDPADLIEAEIIKVPSQKQILKALQSLAKKAEKVIIATDFDREGELIGVDAVNKIKEVNEDVEIKRARFSSLTAEEIKNAFEKLDDIYLNLAHAGEARQDIDLIWGATLTRFLSLATTRLGNQFLSAGRVQSPTLALIVAREKERNAFKSKSYWQIKGLFEKDGKEFLAVHKEDRFWKKEEAEAILKKLSDTGLVEEVIRKKREQKPPAPFNTTSYLGAAAALGISPSRAMYIAESLYMDGLISYPRVDNTVYPSTMNFRMILDTLSKNKVFGGLARELMNQDTFHPTSGKRRSTDHPPIHPTGLAQKDELESSFWKIYELISRRFMSTLSVNSITEVIIINIDVNKEPFIARGQVVVEEGWLKYYYYSRKKDEELPNMIKGDKIKLIEPIFEEKETQPPSRYSQGSLIKVMEKLELGTKATRHSIIKNLYDRGYIHSDPAIPTKLGISMAEALIKYAGTIASPDMTATLEKDMDLIAEGKIERKEVVNHSREMLKETIKHMNSNKEMLGQEIRNGIYDDLIVGKCSKCGNDLRIIRAKKSKKRFVGCTGYPDCKTAFPLPQFGNIIPTGEVCEYCITPKIKVINTKSSKRKPWILCLDPNCSTKTANNKGNK